MRIRAFLQNLAVTSAALTVSLLAAEGIARAALNPADYLSVGMDADAVLGAAPSRSTAGGAFDAWGFRNRSVPQSADIVAIGDSHTYGNTATMGQSWPYVLASVTGKQVYNMGLGGYGPNQYRHLLPKALTLKPKLVVVGLYMGDDFENAFLITYGLEHWARLRTLSADKVRYDIWATREAPSLNKQVRIWLSRHSVIYQLVFHGPVLGRVQGEAQIRNASLLSQEATTLAVPADDVLEAFRPKGPMLNLDQSKVQVRDGMRITFELLREMKELCRQQGVEMLVAVIPTKEMVFADYFEKGADLPLADQIAKLLSNERVARDRTFEELRQAGIEFVDVMPSLTKARGAKLYARTAGDMHPNGNGYRVIGEAVSAAVVTRAQGKQP